MGTAAITAATYLIFAIGSFTGVILLNLLAGGLIILMTYAVGRLWFERLTAVLAAVIVAVWPNLIFFTSILSSELWFIALTLIGLWFWARPTGNAWANLLLCGIFWGLACYIRPTILLLPLAFAIAALPGGAVAMLRSVAKAAMVIALIIATVSPWTYRNAQVFGEPVLVSTNFGPNLWMGNNPETSGGYTPLPDWVNGMTETARADALGDIAKAYIREDLSGFARRTLIKAAKLHERETIGVAWNKAALMRGVGETGTTALKVLATGYWYVLLLLPLVAVGIRLGAAPLNALFHPAIAAWGYFTLLHAVIVVEDRYHMPSAPFIALLAAQCVHLARGHPAIQRAR